MLTQTHTRMHTRTHASKVELSQKLYSATVDFRRAQKEYMKQKMDQEETRMKGRGDYLDEKTAAEEISEDMILELVGRWVGGYCLMVLVELMALVLMMLVPSVLTLRAGARGAGAGARGAGTRAGVGGGAQQFVFGDYARLPAFFRSRDICDRSTLSF
jgi:hypothetical protein